jgi:hypothetical protein
MLAFVFNAPAARPANRKDDARRAHDLVSDDFSVRR